MLLIEPDVAIVCGLVGLGCSWLALRRRPSAVAYWALALNLAVAAVLLLLIIGSGSKSGNGNDVIPAA